MRARSTRGGWRTLRLGEDSRFDFQRGPFSSPPREIIPALPGESLKSFQYASVVAVFFRWDNVVLRENEGMLLFRGRTTPSFFSLLSEILGSESRDGALITTRRLYRRPDLTMALVHSAIFCPYDIDSGSLHERLSAVFYLLENVRYW